MAKDAKFLMQNVLCEKDYWHIFAVLKMVVVAQLVRVPDCGSGGRRFEPGLPPIKLRILSELFYFMTATCQEKIKANKVPCGLSLKPLLFQVTLFQ